jgi:hypothetical protein
MNAPQSVTVELPVDLAGSEPFVEAAQAGVALAWAWVQFERALDRLGAQRKREIV